MWTAPLVEGFAFHDGASRCLGCERAGSLKSTADITERAVVETFHAPISGRGMQFQADEAERLIASGSLSSEIMPPSQSVQIMQTLDEVRELIGRRCPPEG